MKDKNSSLTNEARRKEGPGAVPSGKDLRAPKWCMHLELGLQEWLGRGRGDGVPGAFQGRIRWIWS
jgi:hypothetical protein